MNGSFQFRKSTETYSVSLLSFSFVSGVLPLGPMLLHWSLSEFLVSILGSTWPCRCRRTKEKISFPCLYFCCCDFDAEFCCRGGMLQGVYPHSKGAAPHDMVWKAIQSHAWDYIPFIALPCAVKGHCRVHWGIALPCGFNHTEISGGLIFS